ncbi:uncharacterized protein N7484_004880 [Penicillium longicatenatum]|uniref:uncharacterized protein n=1 Tax=Penicillium longicatenatum TaxID=1561947 RepID=UPI002549A624|nr:uncharacterized protein N7484_004880 [Penicillium longicatenatum]KAJ5651157.1 hypothetical protein N7484_004880 [Penicillium longicatenatum]
MVLPEVELTTTTTITLPAYTSTVDVEWTITKLTTVYGGDMSTVTKFNQYCLVFNYKLPQMRLC